MCCYLELLLKLGYNICVMTVFAIRFACTSGGSNNNTDRIRHMVIFSEWAKLNEISVRNGVFNSFLQNNRATWHICFWHFFFFILCSWYVFVMPLPISIEFNTQIVLRRHFNRFILCNHFFDWFIQNKKTTCFHKASVALKCRYVILSRIIP